MATVIFAHGFGAEDNKNLDKFKPVEDAVRRAGHEFVAPVFDWSQRPSEWFGQFDQAIDDSLKGTKKFERLILAGFSIGGVIAASRTAQGSGSALVACSMSPFFLENLLNPAYVDEILHGFDISPSPIKLTREQLMHFETLKFRDIAREIAKRVLPTAVLLGGNEVEYRDMFDQSMALAEAAKTELNIIPGIGHDFLHPKYLGAFTEALRNVSINL